jgi:hypothetical protein
MATCEALNATASLVLRFSSFTVSAVAVSGDSRDVFPDSYHQMLCPPVPEPSFEDPGELERVWGERLGSVDEVGTLPSVLMRRPRRKLEQIRADAWNHAARALVDPNGGWYWESEEPSDLPLVERLDEGLVAALEGEGVEVCWRRGSRRRCTPATRSFRCRAASSLAGSLR